MSMLETFALSQRGEPHHAALPPEWSGLQDVGALFYHRGWSIGTSSNYSVVVGRDPFRLLITASGRDKRRLTEQDFVVVDAAGKAVFPGGAKPSAETLLHVAAAQAPDVGAVLHTHSVWGTLLSEKYHGAGALEIEGYEMLKGLAGVGTHEHQERIAILQNTQDMAALSRTVAARLADPDGGLRHGFLLRRHGLYTWGRDLDEARRHVEILEFLFEVLGRQLSFGSV